MKQRRIEEKKNREGKVKQEIGAYINYGMVMIMGRKKLVIVESHARSPFIFCFVSFSILIIVVYVDHSGWEACNHNNFFNYFIFYEIN